MTLREEIQSIIAQTREITEINTSSYITHLIISKIEKRIDEKIEWFKSEYDGTVDPYIIIPYLKEIKELLK